MIPVEVGQTWACRPLYDAQRAEDLYLVLRCLDGSYTVYGEREIVWELLNLETGRVAETSSIDRPTALVMWRRLA